MPDSSSIPVNISGDSFYSREGSALYYCVPKVASRSILGLCTTTFPDGFRIKEKDVPHPEFCQSIEGSPFRFAFVREPIERALSFYFDKCVNYDGSIAKVKLFARYQNLKPTTELNDFIRWLNSTEGRDATADHHFCSQHLFLYSRDWKKCVDYVGYMNTLPSDLARVWSRLGHELPPMPHLNSNADPKVRKVVISSADYLKKLDPSQIRALRKRYEADYDLFNFGQPDQSTLAKLGRRYRTFWRESGLAKVPVK